jgi:hypothetical protein
MANAPQGRETSGPPPVVVVRWPAVAAASAILDLRRWYRQPLAVVTALVLPALVAVLVTGALGGEPQLATTWAVVDDDHGPVARAFIDDALKAPALGDRVDVRLVEIGPARRALERGAVSAVIVLPRDLSESVATEGRATIAVIPPHDATLGTDLAALVVDQFAVRAWAASVPAAGGGAGSNEAWPIALTIESASGHRLDAAAHYGPAIGMFFVLLALGFGAQVHVVDRERGIVGRIVSTSAPLSAVLVGRAAAGVAVGGLSLSATAVTMGLVFDRSWGPPAAVVPLVLAVLVCFTGIAALVATVVRTSAQAQVATTAVAFLLALGSGSFAPPGSTGRAPGAGLVPTTRALDAFAELAVDGAGLRAIWADLAILLGLGAVLLIATLGLAERTT